MTSNYPVGVRFEPTEEELLYDLTMKVKGLPCNNAVTECDIYGDGDKEPWKMFQKPCAYSDEGCFFVITALKRKTRSSRIERNAGSGSWDGRQINKVYDSNGNFIGFDKYFTFKVEQDSTIDGELHNNGRWTMHEYTLVGQQNNDYAICKIRNIKDAKSNNGDDQAKCRRKPNAKMLANDCNSQRSRKRNVNGEPQTQNQKKKRIAENNNKDAEQKQENSCLIPLNPSLELTPTPEIDVDVDFFRPLLGFPLCV